MSINPRPCHSEPVTDVTGVGIRNLLAGNLRKSAGIMRFRNGLPRQSVPQGHLLRGADWLAMTWAGRCGIAPYDTGRRRRRPLRSVTAHAVGRGALTPPHKGDGFPRQCEHWLGMTWAGRCGHRPPTIWDVEDAVPYEMARGTCNGRAGCPHRRQKALSFRTAPLNV